MPKTFRSSFDQALRPLPSVVKGVQACRFPGLPLPCLPPAPTRHQGHSHSMTQPHCTLQTQQRSPGLKPLKMSFARPQSPKTLRGSLDQALRPLPSVVKGVQACRLLGVKPLKCLKPSAAAGTRH